MLGDERQDAMSFAPELPVAPVDPDRLDQVEVLRDRVDADDYTIDCNLFLLY